MTIIEQLRIDAQQNGKNRWQLERIRAMESYLGRTEEETYARFHPQLKKKVPVANNNITRRVIDRVSMVYLDNPERKVTNDKYADKIIVKDMKLQRAERLTNLLGVIAIHPVYRHDQLEYDIITDFEPEFGDDPLVPVGIHYPLAAKSQVGDTTPERWAYWSETEYEVYEKDGKTLQSDTHNLGLLPFVFAFRDGVPESEFLDVDPASDLIDTNHAVNVLLTAMNANILFQSFGVPWASGLNDDTAITVSPDIILSLPEGSQFAFATPPDTVQSVRDGIQFLYQSTAQNYHLSSQFVEGTTAESGVALKIRNQELMEDRKSDLTRWRLIEKQLYEIERKILQKNAGFDPGADFAVDFHENSEMMTPDEQIARDDWNLAHNQTTEAEIKLRENPDLDNIEAAQKVIEANREMNGIKAPAPALSEILAKEPE